MDVGVDAGTFVRLAAVYHQRWSVALHAVDGDGQLVHGQCSCVNAAAPDCQAKRWQAVSACLRWGDPSIEPCACGQIFWAVPLMRNQQVLGGLVAGAPESQVLPIPADRLPIDVRAACADLRLLAERENLTNAALLAARREEYLREQRKADALQQFKESAPYDSIRESFLRQEPSLLAAIRRGDYGMARSLINNMLVAMLHRAGEDVALTKTFFLELVVMMCRTAVEAGGNPEQLLGADFKSLSRLSTIQTSEDLARWLHEVLEHVMGAISAAGNQPVMVRLTAAMNYMTDHLGEDISRDDIAQAAHLSPSHFSRLFKHELGVTCGVCLNQMRVERAAELLLRSDMPLARIAIACGFSDQSYFTKVFRAHFGQTPKAYRTQQLKS